MIYASDYSAGINNQAQRLVSLLSTFATVQEVIDEGLSVNVNLDLKLEGQSTLNNIPLLKMPYLNIPVRVGDKVFLTKMDHLLNNYYTVGVFTEYIPSDSYVAIQCILNTTFKENEFVNHFTLINPEKTFRWILNDEESKIEAETISQTKTFKSSTENYKERVEITIEDSLKTDVTNSIEVSADSVNTYANSINMEATSDASLKASSSLTLTSPSIDLGSEGVKLGSLLQQLCSALASSQCIVTSGSSAGSYVSLSNASQISSIGGQIASVFR